MSDDALADARRDRIGFVFQTFSLVPVLTAEENVAYPMTLKGVPGPEARSRARALLARVGLDGKAAVRPDLLSGGERQRVAIARALANDPEVVLADEPTANLDHDTAYRVIELMKKMRDELGTTFVFSTHDPKIMSEAEVVFTLEDGRLHVPSKKPEAAHV
jgi:putative ABC transport system ATP-binding protein